MTVPSGWLHSEIWLLVTWGKEPLVQIFLHSFPCFTGCSKHEEWHSKLYFCSCFLLMQMPNTKRTYERGLCAPWKGLGLLLASSGVGTNIIAPLCASQDTHCSWEAQRGSDWWVAAYFRRKRCAKKAASRGLTGWASWPSRLRGGMLPNWRLVRKLFASWIVFFSSASSSCWRM